MCDDIFEQFAPHVPGGPQGKRSVCVVRSVSWRCHLYFVCVSRESKGGVASGHLAAASRREAWLQLALPFESRSPLEPPTSPTPEPRLASLLNED